MDQQAKEVITTKMSPTLDSFRGLFLPVLVLGLVLTAQGHCADAAHDLDTMTTNVMNTIFSPWVKKSALVFGAGAGFFKAYASGSWVPLALWGGLGLAVNYIPKVVELISGM
jgi:hypothetical protein